MSRVSSPLPSQFETLLTFVRSSYRVPVHPFAPRSPALPSTFRTSMIMPILSRPPLSLARCVYLLHRLIGHSTREQHQRSLENSLALRMETRTSSPLELERKQKGKQSTRRDGWSSSDLNRLLLDRSKKKLRERKESYCRRELNPGPNYCRVIPVTEEEMETETENRERDEIVARWANRVPERNYSSSPHVPKRETRTSSEVRWNESANLRRMRPSCGFVFEPRPLDVLRSLSLFCGR